MQLAGEGRAEAPAATPIATPTSAVSASHLVAAALAPLRSSGDPRALAGAVCRLLAATLGVASRIDLAGDGLLADLVPTYGVMARSVRPGRPDLADAGQDGGDPATGGVAVHPDPSRDLAWITVPLVAERRAVGMLRVAVEGATSPAPATVADVGGIGVSVATALVEAARRHEAAHISRSLQESLLPHSLPREPWFEVAARYAPATAALQVGGDWYDAQVLASGELALSVGDVAGHGVEAAARMGELRTAMTAMRMVCDGPHQLIGLLHRLYSGSTVFATAICAWLHPSGRFRWSSAGHLHPVVARQGEGAALAEGTVLPPLGAGARGPAVLNERRLAPGETVVLYTDGLVERRDEPLDVSLRRLLSDVGSATSGDPEQLVDHLVSARQRSGPTTDDIAVVAARLRPEGP